MTTAARMLQAVIDAHPEGLTKAQLADVSGVTASGGTFSTYLGDLRRNGLVEQRGDQIVDTDILMYGANAPTRTPQYPQCPNLIDIQGDTQHGQTFQTGRHHRNT